MVSLKVVNHRLMVVEGSRGEQKKGVRGSLNEGDHRSSQHDRGGSGRRGCTVAVEVARQRVEDARKRENLVY